MKQSLTVALLAAFVASPLAATELRLTGPSKKKVVVRVEERVKLQPYCEGRRWYGAPAVPLLWCIPRLMIVPETVQELNAARNMGQYRGPYLEISRVH